MSQPLPSFVQPLPDPLGLYIRPGYGDHRLLLEMLAEGRTAISGVVFDPTWDNRQGELRKEIGRRRLESVLDTRAMELATPGGHNKRRAGLPWAAKSPHRPQDLSGLGSYILADKIAKYVAKHEYSAVLAPAHYVSGPNDPWLPIDEAATARLRSNLDKNGLSEVHVFYPLAVPGKVLREADQRDALIAYLARLPIDAIWLRVHPFGTDSGPHALRGYIETCRDMHRLGLPVIAERTGTIGLPLLAFGAVGGIECGVTVGEKFDFGRLKSPPRKNDKSFSPQPRVYLPDLGIFLSRIQAKALFDTPRMKAFACRDTNCCRRGPIDMVGNPRRHFMIQRMGEVARLSEAAPPARVSVYLEEMLRHASDLIPRALRGKFEEHAPNEVAEALTKKLETERHKLEGWRYTLGKMAQHNAGASSSPVPQPPASRRHR